MLANRRIVFLDLEASLLIAAILARVVAVIAFGTLERNLIAGACLGHDASPVVVDLRLRDMKIRCQSINGHSQVPDAGGQAADGHSR